MYYVYVLKSLKDSRYYIGYTQNLKTRINKHNSGLVKSTTNRRPLRVVYFEQFSQAVEARKRERKIKSMKGGIQFKCLIHTRR